MKLKNVFKDIALFVCFLISGVFMIVFRTSISEGIKNGLSISSEILIPSLFPFLVFSVLASQTGFPFRIGRLSGIVTEKIFHLPSQCFSVILFGFIGGYPVGARLCREMYENDSLTEENCNRLFAFCVNAGPSFVVTAVGDGIIRSRKTGFILLISVCVASVVTGIVTGAAQRDVIIDKKPILQKKEFSDALIYAVSSATESIFSICSWVILFSAFLAVVDELNLGETVRLLIFSLTEVTSGIESAAKFGGLPFVAACISFGGISILFQLLPIIKKCGVKVKTYLFFRIVNSVISYFLTKLILCFVDVSAEVFAYPAKLFSTNAPASAALLMMCALFVYQLNGDWGWILSRRIRDSK